MFIAIWMIGIAVIAFVTLGRDYGGQSDAIGCALLLIIWNLGMMTIHQWLP